MNSVAEMISRENLALLPLAGVGLAKGLAEVYVKPFIKERPAETAWALLLGGAICYDLVARENQTLSEACDRAIERHPVMTLGAIAITAGHLANVLPERIDPIHQIHKVLA